MASILEQVRLAAALAHSAQGADVELVGPGRRWLVSYDRADATVDPCGFRRLALATLRGCIVGLLPVEGIALVGAVQPLGGGVFGPVGSVEAGRYVVTGLGAEQVKVMLDECPLAIPDQAMAADIHGDEELGTTVIAIRASTPTELHRVDEVARWAAGTCLVEELLRDVSAEAAR